MRLSISQKFFAGITVLMILVVALGFGAFYTINRLEGALDHAVDKTAKSAVRLGDIRVRIRELQEWARHNQSSYVVSKTGASIVKEEAAIATCAACHAMSSPAEVSKEMKRLATEAKEEIRKVRPLVEKESA